MPRSSRPAHIQTSRPKSKGPARGNAPPAHSNHRPPLSRSSNAPLRLPLPTQDLILSSFTTALAADLHDPSLPARIQTLKGHLYDRAFDRVFDDAAARRAYATRWSASRALAYAELLVREPLLAGLLLDAPDGPGRGGGGGGGGGSSNNGPRQQGAQDGGSVTRPPTVTCLGGGAGAELVGLAGARRHVRGGAARGEGAGPGALDVRVFDVADWRNVLDLLGDALAAAHADAAGPGAPEVSLRFVRQDVLAADVAMAPADATVADAVSTSTLVTLLFTLNELYAASLAGTTRLLMSLGAWARPGTRLLVVDSPGSYATVQLGSQRSASTGEGEARGQEKRYPMQWLLDRTLLGEAYVDQGAASGEGILWRKVLQDDSRWFRKAEGISYPIELEDMRYQLHLYERL